MFAAAEFYRRMASIPNVVYNKTEKKARKGRLEITEHYIVFIKVVYGANAIVAKIRWDDISLVTKRNISRDSESANKSQHQRLTFQVRESRKGISHTKRVVRDAAFVSFWPLLFCMLPSKLVLRWLKKVSQWQ